MAVFTASTVSYIIWTDMAAEDGSARMQQLMRIAVP
jgi:hypothetical protein